MTPRFNSITAFYYDIDDHSDPEEDVNNFLKADSNQLVLFSKNNEFTAFFMENEQLIKLPIPRNDDLPEDLKKILLNKKQEKFFDVNLINQIEAKLIGSVNKIITDANHKMNLQWYEFQEIPDNKDFKPGIIYVKFDSDNLGFNYTTINKLPSKKNKREEGYIAIDQLGINHQSPLTLKDLEAEKEKILTITNSPPNGHTLRQTQVMNWPMIVSLLSSQKNMGLLITTYNLLYKFLKDKKLPSNYKKTNLLPENIEDMSDQIQNLIIDLINQNNELFFELPKELKLLILAKLEKTNLSLYEKLEKKPELNLPFNQEWIMNVAKLIYPLTKRDMEGLCSGIVGTALISIYSADREFGLINLSKDPTTLSHSQLMTFVKHSQGCILYENKIFYYNQNKITEVSDNKQDLVSLLNRLPLDKAVTASQEDLKIIKPSLRHLINRFQLFEDIFYDGLLKIAKYDEEIKKIKSMPNASQQNEQLNALTKKIKSDYSVISFFENILLIGGAKEHSIEMLANEPDSLSQSHKQILRSDVLKSTHHIPMILSLLESDSNIRAIDEVGFVGFYSLQDLKDFFDSILISLKESLEADSKFLNYPISFTLSSLTHIMLVTIEPNLTQQIIIRPNFLQKQNTSSDEVALNVKQELFDFDKNFEFLDRKSIAIDIYAHADDLDFTKKWLLNQSASPSFIDLHKRGFQSENNDKSLCFLNILLGYNDEKAAKLLSELMKLGMDPTVSIPTTFTDNAEIISYIKSHTDSFDCTPLAFAIASKKYKCIETLLSSPLIKNANKYLVAAINNGDLELVKILIDSKKVDLNHYDRHFYKSILMIAIATEKLEMVRYLIEKGADVNYYHPLMEDTVLSLTIYRDLSVAKNRNISKNIINLLLDNNAKMYDTKTIKKFIDGEEGYNQDFAKKILNSEFDDKEMQIKYLKDKKENAETVRLIESIDYLKRNNERTIDDNYYSQRENIYSELFFARKNEHEYQKKVVKQDNSSKENLEIKRNKHLDKVADLLMQNEDQLDRYKKSIVPFDRETITDSMYSYLQNKLGLINKKNPNLFFTDPNIASSLVSEKPEPASNNPALSSTNTNPK